MTRRVLETDFIAGAAAASGALLGWFVLCASIALASPFTTALFPVWLAAECVYLAPFAVGTSLVAGVAALFMGRVFRGATWGASVAATDILLGAIFSLGLLLADPVYGIFHLAGSRGFIVLAVVCALTTATMTLGVTLVVSRTGGTKHALTRRS